MSPQHQPDTNDMIARQGPFTVRIGFDAELATTVIALSYTDATDQARDITVKITPELGSNMFGFRVGEHDLIYYERDRLKRRDFTGNFVLWPLPNRVRDKRYHYRGRTYSLEAIHRPQGNAVLIHGLVFDQPWRYEQPVITAESVSVTTFIDFTPATPHYDAYPFDSRLALTFTVKPGEGEVTVTYRVSNNGTQHLPFGFAMHPYFALLSGREQTYVSLPAEAVMEADEELLPTGRIFDINKIMYAMYDLRQPLPLHLLKLDHVYYTGLNRGAAAVIDYRQQNIQLHISTTDDFSHIVIYTPRSEPYFCLEHQTCSTDAVNLANRGKEYRELAHLLEVAPGESASGTIRYRVQFE
ncbi:MAG: aldose 1-epimerase [Ktedonobacteraceae bacterium]|nr:aldose 1-epimerase [Ktedonobacteraceae bacterium]